jgi:hypothetical protein
LIIDGEENATPFPSSFKNFPLEVKQKLNCISNRITFFIVSSCLEETNLMN